MSYSQHAESLDDSVDDGELETVLATLGGLTPGMFDPCKDIPSQLIANAVAHHDEHIREAVARRTDLRTRQRVLLMGDPCRDVREAAISVELTLDVVMTAAASENEFARLSAHRAWPYCGPLSAMLVFDPSWRVRADVARWAIDLPHVVQHAAVRRETKPAVLRAWQHSRGAEADVRAIAWEKLHPDQTDLHVDVSWAGSHADPIVDIHEFLKFRIGEWTGDEHGEW